MTLGEEKSGADMSEGYIKLWRKSLDTGMIKNHSLWALWTWCLLKASWQPIKLWVGKREVELQSGQFIFGRLKASEETGLSEQTIRTCMCNLVNAKNLTIKVTNKFSIVTICNWETYQGNGIPYNQQTNQPLTSNQPATNHKQEVKKVRIEEEKKRYGEHVLLSDPEYQKLIERFGESLTTELIETMNLYAESKAKKFKEYSSHYATLLNWARRDGITKPAPQPKRKFINAPQ